MYDVTLLGRRDSRLLLKFSIPFNGATWKIWLMLCVSVCVVCVNVFGFNMHNTTASWPNGIVDNNKNPWRAITQKSYESYDMVVWLIDARMMSTLRCTIAFVCQPEFFVFAWILYFSKPKCQRSDETTLKAGWNAKWPWLSLWRRVD